MKKGLAKGLVALILVVTMAFEPFFVSAADIEQEGKKTPENVDAIEDTNNIKDSEIKEEQPTDAISVELKESLTQYFSAHDSEVSALKKLTISIQNEYALSMEDLEFIQTNMPVLGSMDVTQCTFDSRETSEAYHNYFKSIEGFAYEFVENAFPMDEPDTEERETEATIPDMDLMKDEEAKNYNLKLNGICLIDKGNKADVGVAYESDDPNVEFRWLQYNVGAQEWTQVSEWSKGNWITWNPRKAGDYWIYAEARTTDGKTASSVYGYHYQGLQVELQGICVLNRGNKFDMGVAYQSNDPGLMFQWKIYNLAKQQWTLIQGKATGNWTSWSPSDAGDYWIHAEAIDSNGNVKSTTMGFRFEGLRVSLNGICTIKKKNQIDMGVAYDTNDDKVRFRWKIYDLSEKKWMLLNEWSVGNWVSWKPAKSGDYWLYVEAKNANGQVQSQVMGYRLSGAKITSFTVSPEPPNWAGNKVQLKGSYQDALGEVDFSRVVVYDGKTWKEIGRASQNIEWCPTRLGNYLLCYEIYGKAGRLIEQKFCGYSVEKPYVDMSSIRVRKAGDLQYEAFTVWSTNDREIKFRWLYYDVAANQWHEIEGWGNSSEINWTAPKEGPYWLHVEARLHDGTVKTQTTGVNVERYPPDLYSMMLTANYYSSGTPYLILTNLSTHKVGVFQGWQGNWNRLAYWDCASGAPESPTVTGEFAIGNRGYYFDSGSSRCFWYTQFYGDYLFHSVLYNRDGSLQDGRLGMSLSHGCVRLDINNAKWIYDNIPYGTKVVVYD